VQSPTALGKRTKSNAGTESSSNGNQNISSHIFIPLCQVDHLNWCLRRENKRLQRKIEELQGRIREVQKDAPNKT